MKATNFALIALIACLSGNTNCAPPEHESSAKKIAATLSSWGQAAAGNLKTFGDKASGNLKTFGEKASGNLKTLGDKATAGAKNLKKTLQETTDLSLKTVGLNRVNVGFKFTAPKLLGSNLIPEKCPKEINLMEELFPEGEAKAFDPNVPSKLYCKEALGPLAKLDSVTLLKAAAKAVTKNENAKVKNALLALMYRDVRLHHVYMPGKANSKFNKCMAALEKVKYTCAADPCTEADLDVWKKSLLEEQDIKESCLKLPTMQRQIGEFIDKLKQEMAVEHKTAKHVHTLHNPEGINSAFKKAAAESSGGLLHLLPISDADYRHARDNIAHVLFDFNVIRHKLFEPAAEEFKKADGQDYVPVETGSHSHGENSMIQKHDVEVIEMTHPEPPKADEHKNHVLAQ